MQIGYVIIFSNHGVKKFPSTNLWKNTVFSLLSVALEVPHVAIWVLLQNVLKINTNK